MGVHNTDLGKGSPRGGRVLLMRPNKVETAVQCSICRMWVFAGFSGDGNLIDIILIPLIIYNLIPAHEVIVYANA